MLLFVCLTHRPPPYYYKVGINEVRCVSRSVEGLHSLLARVLKRAPAAKVPYISFEMRSAQLAQLGYQPAVSFLQLIHRHTKTHTHTLQTDFKLELELEPPPPPPLQVNQLFFYNCNSIVTTAVMAPALDRQAGQDITDHIATNQCRTVPVPFTVTGCVV